MNVALVIKRLVDRHYAAIKTNAAFPRLRVRDARAFLEGDEPRAEWLAQLAAIIGLRPQA